MLVLHLGNIKKQLVDYKGYFIISLAGVTLYSMHILTTNITNTSSP